MASTVKKEEGIRPNINIKKRHKGETWKKSHSLLLERGSFTFLLVELRVQVVCAFLQHTLIKHVANFFNCVMNIHNFSKCLVALKPNICFSNWKVSAAFYFRPDICLFGFRFEVLFGFPSSLFPAFNKNAVGVAKVRSFQPNQMKHKSAFFNIESFN